MARRETIGHFLKVLIVMDTLQDCYVSNFKEVEKKMYVGHNFFHKN